MTSTHLLIIDGESYMFPVLTALKQRYGVEVTHVTDWAEAVTLIETQSPDCVLLNPTAAEQEADQALSQLTQAGLTAPVILVGSQEAATAACQVYVNVLGHVTKPYVAGDLVPFLSQRPKGKRRGLALAERARLLQNNRQLERRLQEMSTLFQVGKAVASLTDLDAMLARIVEAAVFLLGAEEGSLMLVDPETHQLYLRAQKGLGEKHAHGFNVRIQDTLIGSVVRTGRPVMMGRASEADERFKVVTGYLVNSLLYVPLTLRQEVIGVLGVDNKQSSRPFYEGDQRLLSALADYAAVAIENARQRESLNHLRQGLAASSTLAEAVDRLRQTLQTDDPALLDALEQIERATETLTQLGKA